MICFWTDSRFFYLSNFEPVKLFLDQEEWNSVEHYYQAQKFLNPEIRLKIKESKAAGKTKRLARKHKDQIRPDWEDIKLSVMEKALRSKFNQSPFKEQLLATGDAEILEDSPQDLFWGTGLLGKPGLGLNHLGKLLMKIRQDLKSS